MALSTQQQMLVEQRVGNDSKSILVAYLLAIFFGGFGIHRFYLGRSGSAAAMLIMFVLGWVTFAIVVGIILLIAVGIWVIVDLFLIPGMVESQKNDVRARISQELEAMGGDDTGG
ncbi:TM2 domain-containing protein [Candidatus Rhodobacter oscarellae]|uniref:TM2 domain-containing protein n=1 Tax=Candidatus Rhodobacter oscarellae TaxID=1675527 RepID=UPI00067114E0|nr:TM2 domain-containing protein [Candidatus Rhodobacter lobularis]